MYFKPQVTDRDFPELLKQFVHITGWTPWRKRFDWLIDQADRTPVMPYFLRERFPLELAFFDMQRHYRTTGKHVRKDIDEQQQRIISFVAMITMCYSRLTEMGKSRLKGMLLDGLKSDYGLGPLAHEMRMAAHLMNIGFDVTFNDMENGRQFDYLATKNTVKIEVECKFVSGDIGRKIHLRRLHQFGESLIPRLNALLHTFETGLLIRLTIPTRLHGDLEQHITLCELVQESVKNRNSFMELNDAKVSISEFGLEAGPFANSPPEQVFYEDVELFLQNEFGIVNRNCLLAFRPRRSAIIVVVESSQQDEVLKGIHRQLKDAARTQFSGDCPAVFCCHLADLTGDQLQNLKVEGEGGIGLDYMTSDLIHRRPQLLSVTFTASGHLKRTPISTIQGVSSSLQESGHSYTIVNSSHEVASDNRFSIF